MSVASDAATVAADLAALDAVSIPPSRMVALIDAAIARATNNGDAVVSWSAGGMSFSRSYQVMLQLRQYYDGLAKAAEGDNGSGMVVQGSCFDEEWDS